MITFAVMAVMALLIILERMKKIKLANMGGALVMIIGSSICLGLYAFEFVKPIISVISNIFNFEEDFPEYFNSMSKGMSNTHSVIQIVILMTLFIPFAIGIIYIIVSLVKRPVNRLKDETDEEFYVRCGIRGTTLAIICVSIMIISIVICVLLSIPYWQYFKESLEFLNPGLLFFAVFFTFGIGVVYFAGVFTAVNSQLLLIMLAGSFIVFALYVYSVILGIASCVRAVKLRAVKPIPAFVSGICMFMIGWNIIPILYVRKKIKKNSEHEILI